MISNAVLATRSPRMLGVLRIVAALLFVQHGLAKLLHFPHVAMFNEFQLFSLLGLAGVIALVGGVLLLIGFFTRPVAFTMSGETAVAYFMAHAPRGFFPILNQASSPFCFASSISPSQAAAHGVATRYAEGRSAEEISWQIQAGVPVHKATVVDLDPAAVL